MKFKNYILSPVLNDASYPGNIGFEELISFYKKADETQIKKMEKIIKDGDWNKFRNMIYNVLGVKLK